MERTPKWIWKVGALWLSILVCPVDAAPEKIGDFDEDGMATILDVVRLINHVNGTRTLSSELVPFADINNDGFVDQNDVQGLVDRVLGRLPLDSLPLTFLSKGSPSSGEGNVAVTRETILKFSSPLGVEHGLDSDSLFAEFGGSRLSTRINVSRDRKTVTLFYDQPLPANSRIRVTLVGDEIFDNRGRKIDGNGDGEPGGDLVFDFDTLGLTVLEGTSVSGRVFASELTVAAAADVNVNQPLEGALITVDGMEDEIFAVTDEFGNFRLEPAPVGRFFVHIDGRAATVNVPPGAYYPFVGKAWESIPGEEVNIGTVYLPLVKEGTLQNVSGTNPTTIRMAPVVLDEFPDFENVSITVPTDSLFSDNGTRGGMVGIAPVDPSRLPGTLPPDLNFPIVITVQTDGATNFDTPAPICFPNLPDLDTGEVLQPGEKSALWSFNHDTGRFEITASMTVSPDGSLICSDPGEGVLAPGWHGTRPGAVVEGGVIVSNTAGPVTTVEIPSTVGSHPPACAFPDNRCETGIATDVENPNSKASLFSKTFGGLSTGLDEAITALRKGANAMQAAIAGNGKPDPIHYFSGEFYYSSEDLRIKGRGMDFVWSRKYRSRTGPDTAQGKAWDFSYNLLLIPDGEDILVCDGNSRADRFEPNGNGRWTRDEFFRELVRNPDGTFILQFEDTSKWIYNALDASVGPGHVTAIEDRNGNRIEFFYDSQDRLIRVNDTLDRDIMIAYNAAGFISSVTDFVGRVVSYEYYGSNEPGGSFGDLKSCTSPAITGTPNGNDFPSGKTISYTYTKGFSDERLNHNLLTITDGRRNDPDDSTFGDGPFVVNSYTATQDPNDINYDRVTRQVWGGGIIDLTYLTLTPAGGFPASTKTIVNDRNGNVGEYFYDERNRLIALREFTGRANPAVPTGQLVNRPVGKLRASDPEFFETRYSWNDDSQPIQVTHPNGNITQYIYESDLNPLASIRNRGNLRIVRRLPGSHVPTGDQPVIEEQFEYDDSFGCGSCAFNFVTRHTDGKGNQTLMTYDSSGNLLKTTHRIASIVEDFEYNQFGQLVAQVYPDNGSSHRRRDEYIYYDAGPQRGYLQSSIFDVENFALTTTYAYDVVGNPVSVTDSRGNDEQSIYNQLDQLVRSISREVGDGSGVRYERDIFYDANDNVVQLNVENIDDTGSLAVNTHFTTSWEYDILNYPIRMIQEVDDSHDIVTEYQYDANRNRVLLRKGEATSGSQSENVVARLYDERDLLLSETRSPESVDRSTTQFDYDGNQNLVESRQGIEDTPRVTLLVYDGYDRRIAKVDSMGNEEIWEYDANTNVVRTLIEGELDDAPGNAGNILLSESAYSYDKLDRLVRKDKAFYETATGEPIDDGFSTSAFVYTDHSAVKSTSDDDGNPTIYTYDSVNRLSSSTDAMGNVRTYSYDSNSNIVAISSREKDDLGGPDQLFTTTFRFDNMDRPISSTDNRGNEISMSYDSRNNQSVSVDALGNVVRHAYDGLNRLVSTVRILTDSGLGSGTEIGQVVTQNVWDDSSRLVQQIDPNGNLTTTEFDALDRAVVRTFADGTKRQVSYDAHDNVVFEQDANGNTVESEYDLLDRLIARNVTPGAGVSNDTEAENFGYDGLSRVVTVEDDDSSVLFTYDSLSNLTSEAINGQVTVSLYDGEGNLLNCLYPGGRNIEYQYDPLDRKVSILDVTGPTPLNVVNVSYVGPDRIARRDYGNGNRTNVTYNGISGVPDLLGDFGVRNIVNIEHSRIASGTVFAEHQYHWDPMGNKTGRVDVANSIDQSFTYDSAYRLVQSETEGAIENYSIDLSHNRSFVSGGSSPGAYLLDATAPDPADAQLNQYSSTPRGNRIHDFNGNVLTDTINRSFEYDFANRIVGYSGGGDVASYQYDALGRRIAKTVNGEVTQYFYAGGDQVCEEQNAANETIATYIYGQYVDDLVQMQRNGEDYYYHSDDLRSTVALSDENGDLVESTSYGDYGEPSSPSTVENPYLYTGQRYDPETGFYYYRTRYMDPSAGRFTSRDIIGIWGDPMEFGNGYAYVGNNPHSFIDPYGLKPSRVKRTFRVVISGLANAASLVSAVAMVETGVGAPAGWAVGTIAVAGLNDNAVEVGLIYYGEESAEPIISQAVEGVTGSRRLGHNVSSACGAYSNLRTLNLDPSKVLDHVTNLLGVTDTGLIGIESWEELPSLPTARDVESLSRWAERNIGRPGRRMANNALEEGLNLIDDFMHAVLPDPTGTWERRRRR